jgi:hypothetical protein
VSWSARGGQHREGLPRLGAADKEKNGMPWIYVHLNFSISFFIYPGWE